MMQVVESNNSTKRASFGLDSFLARTWCLFFDLRIVQGVLSDSLLIRGALFGKNEIVCLTHLSVLGFVLVDRALVELLAKLFALVC